MKRTIYYLMFLFLMLIATSCAGIRQLTVETLEPAQITLPEYVKSIVIVNNVVQQPDDVGHDVKTIGNSTKDRTKASSDSVAIYYTEALAQFIDEENYFSRVLYYNKPLRDDTYFFQEHPIEPETMGEILNETKVDAIISLDNLLMTTDVREHFKQQGYTYCDMTGKTHSVLRVYLPTMDGKIPAVVYEDSLHWNGFDIRDEKIYAAEMIPSREEAMKIMAVRAAEKMTNVFAPHWELQGRWYYVSASSLMREGAAFAKESKWADAIDRWKRYYNAKSNKVDKGKAANNIALAYEMMDDMEEAYRWASVANDMFIEKTGLKSTESRRSQIYKNELQRRMDSSNKINMRK